MKDSFVDILALSYPRASSRKRLSMTERAAQFSPFAALSGYDTAIRETERLTDEHIVLEWDEKGFLNEKICLLAEFQKEHPEITVCYFVPDEKKHGGSYEHLTGRIKKIDLPAQAILMANGTVVNFDRIRDIYAEIFLQYEALCF